MAVYGFDEAKNKVEIFPVGYIYMSVSPENPGGGVWRNMGCMGKRTCTDWSKCR